MNSRPIVSHIAPSLLMVCSAFALLSGSVTVALALVLAAYGTFAIMQLLRLAHRMAVALESINAETQPHATVSKATAHRPPATQQNSQHARR